MYKERIFQQLLIEAASSSSSWSGEAVGDMDGGSYPEYPGYPSS